jgi:hypothetical protein
MMIPTSRARKNQSSAARKISKTVWRRRNWQCPSFGDARKFVAGQYGFDADAREREQLLSVALTVAPPDETKAQLLECQDARATFAVSAE